MQCDQFKELLKDKEEEIQTLIQELDTGRTQSLDQDEIGMMNNQVFFCGTFHNMFQTRHTYTNSCKGTSGKKIVQNPYERVLAKNHCRGYLIGY